MESLAVMVEAVLGRRGIDVHAADGVADGVSTILVIMAVDRMLGVTTAARTILRGRRCFARAAATGVSFVVQICARRIRHADAPVLQPIPGRGI
jgi:hypothetical protein